MTQDSQNDSTVGQRATSGAISGPIAAAGGAAASAFAAAHGADPATALAAGGVGAAVAGGVAASIAPWSAGVLARGDQATGVLGFVWSVARLPFLVLSKVMG